jgi:hypothetical protein
MNRINKSVGWGWAVSAVLFLATSAQAQMFRGVGVKPAGETKATSNEVRVEQEGQGTNAPAESPKTKTTRPDREKGRAVQGRPVGDPKTDVVRREAPSQKEPGGAAWKRTDSFRNKQSARPADRASQPRGQKRVGAPQGGRLTAAGRPAPIRDKREILATKRSQSMIGFPKTDHANRPFRAKGMTGAPGASHMAPARNSEIMRYVRDIEPREVVRNRYYWHHRGGHRFCHYYDDWGYHWYGWYAGDAFFWTRYYSGRWWWYDSSFDRWCYWHDSGWWWQDPRRGLVYVYVNNTYTPVETSTTSVSEPDASDHTEFWDAADKKVVKVYGGDAFLYGPHNPPRFDPVFLASGVEDVKFSKAKNGRPLRIMLTLTDGSFEMFDGEGNPFVRSEPY